MANPEWDNYNPLKCKRCDGSGNEPDAHSDLPEPGSGKWYSQSYVDDLNARLEATQKANGASVISSASPLSEGVSLIAAERKRQDSTNDASLVDDQLSDSALLMLDYARGGTLDWTGNPMPCAWKMVKRHAGDRVRLLTIAGAFIAAEIDRLSASAPSPEDKGSDNG